MSAGEDFDQEHTIALGGTGGALSVRILKPGDIVGGAYVLKSLLGRGGMGYVFRAEHSVFKRDYALKLLAPEQLNQASRQRFEAEGRAIANLNHANIVKVYNMGIDAYDCPYYVMDLLAGMSLAERIDAQTAKAETWLTFENCLEIFKQIAAGLAYAHSKGIVHRDVKPSNVILLPRSAAAGGWDVKIVDFGIAKILNRTDQRGQSQTATGEVFGSPYYMSPEQSMGQAIDLRTDIYSLGCTLFEALCGEPPFLGGSALETIMKHQTAPIPSVRAAQPDRFMPESIDFMLARMLAKKSSDRYQTMDDVIHDMERIENGKSIGKVAPAKAIVVAAAAEPGAANSHSWQWAAISILIAVLVVAIIGGWHLFYQVEKLPGKYCQCRLI